MWIGHLCFLIGIYQSQSFILSQKMGYRRTIFLEDYISKRCLPGHRERYFLGPKTGKRSGEDLYLQIAEKEFVIKVFFKPML